MKEEGLDPRTFSLFTKSGSRGAEAEISSLRAPTVKTDWLRLSLASTARRIWLCCCRQTVTPHPSGPRGVTSADILSRHKPTRRLPLRLSEFWCYWCAASFLSHSRSTLPTHSKTNSDWSSLSPISDTFHSVEQIHSYSLCCVSWWQEIIHPGGTFYWLRVMETETRSGIEWFSSLFVF